MYGRRDSRNLINSSGNLLRYYTRDTDVYIKASIIVNPDI